MSMNYKKGIVPFQWEDPLFLDQQLTEEERMIRDAARDFAQNRLAPTAAAREKAAVIEQDVITELGELGFLGMTIDPDWGGAGADYTSYALALTEIAAGDGALEMSDESRQLVVLLNQTGNFGHATGTNTVEDLNHLLHPLVAKGFGEGLKHGTLTGRGERAGFFSELERLGLHQQVGQTHGTWVQIQGLGGGNDFVAGGDKLQGLTKLYAGSLLGAFVNVGQ